MRCVRSSSRLSRLLLAVVMLAAGVGIGMGAMVAASGGDTVYTACVNTYSGTIKMIDANQRCSRNQERITWNRSGPAGPAGLTWRGVWDSTATYTSADAVAHAGSSYIALEAATANTGIEPGSAGAAGVWDLLAAKGDKGDTSDTGPKGDTGEKGESGDTGPLRRDRRAIPALRAVVSPRCSHAAARSVR